MLTSLRNTNNYLKKVKLKDLKELKYKTLK